MNRRKIHVAVSDPALRDEIAGVLRAAGFGVHFDADDPDAGIALLDMETRARQRQSWQRALRDGRSIATAVGILMERHGLPATRAFEALRRQARAERVQLTLLASRVIAGAAHLAFAAPAPPSCESG